MGLLGLIPIKRWVVVLASIGDCKVFHWHCSTGAVSEITEGNRHNSRDARDCGGRLGPAENGGMPDTRNFSLHTAVCEESDLLFFVSDGVHDNLDPEHLGFMPHEILGDIYPQCQDLGITAEDDWDTIDLKAVELIKNAYRKWRLGCIIEKARAAKNSSASAASTLSPLTNALENDANSSRSGTGSSSSSLSGSSATTMTAPALPGSRCSWGTEECLLPGDVVPAILDHCIGSTAASRVAMEESDGTPLAADYKLYPGKMDHTTCACIRVTNYSL